MQFLYKDEEKIEENDEIEFDEVDKIEFIDD